MKVQIYNEVYAAFQAQLVVILVRLDLILKGLYIPLMAMLMGVHR